MTVLLKSIKCIIFLIVAKNIKLHLKIVIINIENIYYFVIRFYS